MFDMVVSRYSRLFQLALGNAPDRLIARNYQSTCDDSMPSKRIEIKHCLTARLQVG